MSIPLDDDGFLLRQCDACSRRFRWLIRRLGDPADGVYTCPYCGARRDADAWWTDEQADYITWVGSEPMLKELSKSSGLRIEMSPAPPLPVDDAVLERVDFHCHPSEPVKVYPEWVGAQPVHCLICGEPAS